MRAEAIRPSELPSFLRANLDSSFKLYMHILGEPFVSLLCSLPSGVKASSAVFLDSAKQANLASARRLLGCGYSWVYFVRNLHAKLLVADRFLVIGSMNYSARAVGENVEVVIVLWGRPGEVAGLRQRLAEIEKRGTYWRYILR